MVTIDELKRDAVGSLDIDLTDQTVNPDIGFSYKEVSEDAVKDASSDIDSYLDKSVMISKHTEFIRKDDWYYNEARNKYEHIPNNYPIVQSTTEFDGIYLLSDSRPSEVTYYAGYRRSDQTLGDLQETLPELTNLPPILPGTIRRVCVNLALYYIVEAYDRLIPYESMEKNMGGAISTIRKDIGSPERQLSKLEGWRRLQ